MALGYFTLFTCMANIPTQEYNPRRSSELNIEQLISAPLVAASNANAMMARDQTKFLMDFCFAKDGDSYKPVMIEMHLTNSVIEPAENAGDPPSIRRVKTVFQVPMITLVPINTLAVETIDVEFDLEISSQHKYADNKESKKQKDKEADAELNSGRKGLFKSKSAELKGKISYDTHESVNSSRSNKYQSRNSSKLKVKIHAGQLPLPVGVASILEAFSKGIQHQPPQYDESDAKTSSESTKS